MSSEINLILERILEVEYAVFRGVCLWNPPQPGYTMPIMWTIRECDCSCQWALVWSADAAVVTVTLSGACLPFYLVGTWPVIFTPARLRSPWHRSSAVKRSIGFTTGCTITEKAPTRTFSWLKAPTSAFKFKTLR